MAATLPSGAISESSPSSGFSAARINRRGAPFHGASGDGRTASSAASSQLPSAASARASVSEKRKTKNPPAISDNADAAVASWRAGNIEPPNPSPQLPSIAKALAESWQNPHLPRIRPGRTVGWISRTNWLLTADLYGVTHHNPEARRPNRGGLRQPRQLAPAPSAILTALLVLCKGALGRHAG